jgi:hypothetical protein
MAIVCGGGGARERVSALTCSLEFDDVRECWVAACSGMRDCEALGQTRILALTKLRALVERVAHQDGVELAHDFKLLPVER